MSALRTKLVLSSLAVFTACASASEQGDLLLLLACAPLGIELQDKAATQTLLRRLGTEDGNGGWRVAGPIRSGNACVESVEVTAAFGVLLAAGRLCNEDHRPLTDLLRRAEMPLQSKHVPDPRVLAAYEAGGKYSISFVKGKVSLDAGSAPQDAGDSGIISYACTYRGSGPQ